ncbi:xanthine dehydrogenase family protein molybdopterin-binding subunit [Foetidibacter luteolus]|uniref:xanthine dehydrogenase family protein molybdopterin-binding subunit n=1 Tax=Foetidibacter luteolus TaxID=2608880 RepID=UPI00129BB231|nr:molybdopterin cofactor-binding domain-containing protein [Foetidibacter luteolus]
MKYNREGNTRRVFLQQAGMSGLALVIGSSLAARGKEFGKSAGGDASEVTGTELMSWISIDTSGKVTIFNHRSEMGQGTWQAIPQIIAEELEVDMKDVTVKYAAAHPKKYGPQPQEGSFSVRGWYLDLLRTGATAREMLIAAAAGKWQVHASECYAENGKVWHRKTKQSFHYGMLVMDAARLTPSENVSLKERKDYKIIGKPLPRKDAAPKINGTAIFGLDKKLPGMLYAVVERNPRIRGKVKSFDDTATRSVAGVRHVMKVQRAVFGLLLEGVAVVADTLWAAMQGRKQLKIVWDDDGFEHLDSAEITARMQENLTKPIPSQIFEDAFKQANRTTEAFYEMPYQSHSCMEPLNCIADVMENSIAIWGPIQEANWIQADLSERLNIPIENVTVNMTFLGGGFGRKAFTDYPHEAALISKAIKAPVQVVWTREDDMTAGPFRAGAAYRCRGGIDGRGKIHSMQIISTSHFGEGTTENAAPAAVTVNSGQISGMAQPYYQSMPHYSFGGITTKCPIPTMWWRAPGANVDGFACECFIDELAHLAGADPLAFRKAHLNTSRYQAFTDKLAAISNWNNRSKNAGWGVAITESFGSIVGQIVKVFRPGTGKIKIDKVFALIDCGWYVNPDIIHAQVEGSIVMALGAAVFHETRFKDGMAVEKNFNTYRMPRINDIPEIEVHIMENNELPGGVGEPGLPPFAPALCNAIFDLTGKRIRKLPLSLNEF